MVPTSKQLDRVKDPIVWGMGEREKKDQRDEGKIVQFWEEM